MSAIDWAGMWRPERPPLETALRAAIVYLFVQAGLRMVGRKALGQHSTYEIVLLFLVGVAMRQSIVGPDASLTTAMIGLGVVLALDAILARIVRSSPRAANLIEGRVRELVRDGTPDEGAMRRAEVSPDQLLAAVRGHGREGLDEVHRASLERSGHISVVFRDAGDGRARPPDGGSRPPTAG